ncbi:hypothetical protein SAMN04488587_0410 [Methanococcoides vulcani]|uniref:DUF5611 domain-containing protein n=2 Tax=Methanococcoides vulcani TaxID=1353158 RepID=A0A1H9YBK1_9EURY|nr:hypothetical protein SAMN04488587_0410 [Methanococcoides vulcani]
MRITEFINVAQNQKLLKWVTIPEYLFVLIAICYTIAMQEYKLKRGFSPDIERIYEEIEKSFPSEIRREEDKLLVSYGVITELSVYMDGKKLVVDTVTDATLGDDEMILDTNKRFRDFLLLATGYTAKERLKQAKKAVSK